jgi:hypothetical protein
MANFDSSDGRLVRDLLAREIGPIQNVALLHQRPSFDVYRATATDRTWLVKVGQSARLAHEAANLRQANALVGNLAPSLCWLVELGSGRAVLAMDYLPGTCLEPGRLWQASWRRLVQGLLRLHSQRLGGPTACFPLADDFITLSVAEGRYASLPELRPLLAAEANRLSHDSGAASLALYEDLCADVDSGRTLFERPPGYVHGDIWPENVLAAGPRCWLVDWAWMKPSDYALDLANLKLMLDWVWPAGRAHRAFEQLLQRYACRFGDSGVWARMRFYLPLVSLIHLVQFGQAGMDNPENAEAMRACLATAARDRVLWSMPDARQRAKYALSHRTTSEYAVGGDDARANGSVLRRMIARMSAMSLRTLRRQAVEQGNGRA